MLLLTVVGCQIHYYVSTLMTQQAIILGSEVFVLCVVQADVGHFHNMTFE